MIAMLWMEKPALRSLPFRSKIMEQKRCQPFGQFGEP